MSVRSTAPVNGTVPGGQTPPSPSLPVKWVGSETTHFLFFQNKTPQINFYEEDHLLKYVLYVATDKVTIHGIIANNTNILQRTYDYSLKKEPGSTPLISKGYRGQEKSAN